MDSPLPRAARPSAAALEMIDRLIAFPTVSRDSNSCASAAVSIRKVEPLRRALAGKRAWVTGMRRAQSVTRAPR